MAKIGDIVRYLNSVGGGRITRIDGQVAYVDEDGFETPVLLRECVVVTPAGNDKLSSTAPGKKEEVGTKTTKAEPELPPFVETTEGEKINLVLAYAADDLKHISLTTYDAYLVNDSNYCMYVAYMTRGDEDKGWTTRFAGFVEPATQIFLCEVEKSDLTSMDRIAVQYIPFKQGKQFELKGAGCVEQKLDTTKFFKLHCFQRNPYFDEPVIALPIVKNDMAVRGFEIKPEALQQAMKEKAHIDRPQPRKQEKKIASKDEPLVIDLHIAELVDTTAGLSNADMLNLQIDKFREVMDANLRNHGRKIVFIHGKGEGVLRQALLKELNYRYKGHDVQDASFREYGFGATQIKIR